MTAEEIVDLYVKMNVDSSLTNYELIPDVLRIAREEHKNTFDRGNFEQSWRSVKGKGLEKVVEYILTQELRRIGLELVQASDKRVNDFLKIDFGDYGSYLPDVDLAVYQPSRSRVLAILSIKTSLRERITQTAYWRNKLRSNEGTRDIKMFFITPDGDDILRSNRKPKKQRAVIEADIDRTYLIKMSEYKLDDYYYSNKSSNIRLINDLAEDLRQLSIEGVL